MQYHFHGPNRSTHQTSLCEYGGLYIKFDFIDEGFEFCQDINNFKIHSKHNYIGVTLIWFDGYTEGYFLRNITFSDCQVSLIILL